MNKILKLTAFERIETYELYTYICHKINLHTQAFTPQEEKTEQARSWRRARGLR